MTLLCSKDWTGDERLKMIAWTAGQLNKRNYTPDHYTLTQVYQAITNIEYLAEMSADFLEANRHNIENPFPKKPCSE